VEVAATIISANITFFIVFYFLICISLLS